MSAQIIEREGKPEYAVLPYNEYMKLLELAEGVQDAADAREAMRELVSGECIFWPIPITDSGLIRSPILELSDH